MNLEAAYKAIRTFDNELRTEVLPITQIIPQGGKQVAVEGSIHEWSASAEKQLRQKVSYPEEIDTRIPTEMVPAVWSEIMHHESRQPPECKRLPSHLKVIFRQGQIVGFSNPSLVTLRNSQVLDAIEKSTAQLPMHNALVHSIEQLDAAAWQLKLSFPFKHTEPRASDIVEGGISIRFSAAGLHPIQVRNWLRRLWCSNGSSVPICINSVQLRIRGRRDEQFGGQEMLDKISQVIAQGVNELDAKLQAVAGLAEQRVDAKRLLSQIAQKNRLSKNATKQLLRALHEDESGPLHGDGTQYDVWNAITRVATHEQAYGLRESVRKRLELYSGCFSQKGIHLCPSCQKILEPSRN